MLSSCPPIISRAATRRVGDSDPGGVVPWHLVSRIPIRPSQGEGEIFVRTLDWHGFRHSARREAHPRPRSLMSGRSPASSGRHGCRGRPSRRRVDGSFGGVLRAGTGHSPIKNKTTDKASLSVVMVLRQARRFYTKRLGESAVMVHLSCDHKSAPRLHGALAGSTAGYCSGHCAKQTASRRSRHTTRSRTRL
jgi:hypothetical protein